ncbi:hypothetical protein SLEP1_g44654 [Rubroshorea leprosula]|uniref:Uncharacterized protein n=1 Tax=Rubroshorea leprosula TaxID=152421 RepID=A0AAV5LGT2_9ROSI|nr:hypothetical protein SLEP1_g44654 [Rubroshorea leprosula]
MAGFNETQICWVSSNPTWLGFPKPNKAGFRRTLLGIARLAGFDKTQPGWVSPNPARLGFPEPSLAGFNDKEFQISQVLLRKEKKKKWVKIGFVDEVEMREHLEKMKKWVKIDSADGVEIDFAERSELIDDRREALCGAAFIPFVSLVEALIFSLTSCFHRRSPPPLRCTFDDIVHLAKHLLVFGINDVEALYELVIPLTNAQS